MVEYAYAPMHGPRKEVSQERMNEILAKHVKGAPKPAITVVEAPRPPERAAALVWAKPVRTSQEGHGYQQTVCHRFVIAKVRMNAEWVYTASMRRKAPDGSDFPAQVLGSRKTPQEAQALCQEAAQ